MGTPNMFRDKNLVYIENSKKNEEKIPKEFSCLICLDDDAKYPLKTYCNCEKSYHYKCLMQTLRHDGKVKCSVCQNPFSIIFRPNTWKSFLRRHIFTAIGHTFLFVVIQTLIYMFISANDRIEELYWAPDASTCTILSTIFTLCAILASRLKTMFLLADSGLLTWALLEPSNRNKLLTYIQIVHLRNYEMAYLATAFVFITACLFFKKQFVEFYIIVRKASQTHQAI